MDQNFAKKDDSPLLEGGDITKFRSVVGRLMYLAGERPGTVQHPKPGQEHGQTNSAGMEECLGTCAHISRALWALE